MVLAYVLISTGGMDAEHVAKELTAMEEVDSVHTVEGEYDLVVRVKAKDLITLREGIMPEMQKLQGVAHLTSLVATDKTRFSDKPVKGR